MGCIHCASAIDGSEAVANGFGTWLNGVREAFADALERVSGGST